MSEQDPARISTRIGALSLSELEALAQDFRQEIISVCLKNGGHLGASLGAVEIAIALHKVFESPRDALVWDVGHQAYAHKLLTGRRERFASLRKLGGISGFLSREESEHDVFGAGHSSTALSAALAMSWARGAKVGVGGASAHDSAAGGAHGGDVGFFSTNVETRQEATSHVDPSVGEARTTETASSPSPTFVEKNPTSAWTVAIVGDGGLTAGLAFEALNNAQVTARGPLILLLNDNQMSISANVGALPAILAGATAGGAAEFFEGFGFDYIGPIDGHNLGALIGALEGIRAAYAGRPVVLHAITQKGKGYIPAEESPAAFHGVSPVKVEAKSAPAQKTYSDVLGEALCALAEDDPRVVAISAAMPEGTGLAEFARRFPDRFFDVGIAEPHAVTFAAGLATQGLKPVVAIYSTFLQRALDSVIHDVALQKLGVTFAIDRAGIVGADGPTHHGVFDLAYLGMIPGMHLSAPACLDDVAPLLKRALASGQPWAIRYPRGSGPREITGAAGEGLRWLVGAPSSARIVVFAYGAAAPRAAAAARAADQSGATIAVAAVLDCKPLAPGVLAAAVAAPSAALVTIEDAALRGGFGEVVRSALAPRPVSAALGYADHFIAHGTPAELEEREGVSAAAIEQRFRALLSETQ